MDREGVGRGEGRGESGNGAAPGSTVSVPVIALGIPRGRRDPSGESGRRKPRGRQGLEAQRKGTRPRSRSQWAVNPELRLESPHSALS